MAYTVDAVQAKLSGLNETQESIVTVAQWVMFHRRHADRTAVLWRDHMKGLSPSKRLSMIYLANEVVQQSKARKKEEFAQAFSPIIVDATELAYKGASHDIQQKIRRVLEVWRHRNIFETSVLDALEAKADELDKSKASAKKTGLGGSFLSSSTASTPAELQPLVTLQSAVAKAETKSKPAITNASAEYDKLNGAAGQALALPVQASRLSGLLKSLATADSAVSESIRARQTLIEGLEKMIETNKAALNASHQTKAMIAQRLDETETKKREVEDNIMRGLTAAPEAELDFNIDDFDDPSATESRPLPLPPVSGLVSVLPTAPPNEAPVLMPDVTNILASLAPSQKPNNSQPAPSSSSLSSTGSDSKPVSKRRRIDSAEFDQNQDRPDPAIATTMSDFSTAAAAVVAQGPGPEHPLPDSIATAAADVHTDPATAMAADVPLDPDALSSVNTGSVSVASQQA